jgi:hypothetical protein
MLMPVCKIEKQFTPGLSMNTIRSQQYFPKRKSKIRSAWLSGQKAFKTLLLQIFSGSQYL